MSNLNIQDQPILPGQQKNKASGSPTQSDVSSFRRSINKVSHSNNRLKDKNDSREDEAQPDNLPGQELAGLNQESISKKLLQTDKSEAELLQGLRQSMNAEAHADVNGAGVTDFSNTPMSLEQFSLLLQQLTQQKSELGGKWLFSLQDSATPLSKITLHQGATGQWTLSLATSSKTEAQLLSRNLDKLLQRLQASGQIVDRINVDREKDSG